MIRLLFEKRRQRKHPSGRRSLTGLEFRRRRSI
jgi:hypothetical protein